ncbi:putative chromatin remodeling & transcriptional activation CHROMO-DOMAIN family [Helianthus debilis subsp. tardiflorus]
MTPFQALYGQSAPDSMWYKQGDSDNPSIDATLVEFQRLRSLLKANLKRAQQRMASLANEHRLDKEFKVGDMVFLRLRDYRQHSVQFRAAKKLSKRFYGPFKIIERVGAVAYRLQLPPGSKIHPVFHVSLLREAFGNPEHIPLPIDPEQASSTVQPSHVLDYRWVNGKLQILMAWAGQDVAEATWEWHADIRSRYPDFQLEDELSFKGGAVDTTQPINGPSNRPKREYRRPARLLD